jgi:Fe2+ transport system protein B
MNDKNYSEIEQRLFLLLDTVEQQAQENQKLQEKIADMADKLDKKTDSLNADIDDKLEVAEKKIDVTQNRFDALVFTSAKKILEQELPDLVAEVITEKVDFTPIATSLDEAVKDLNKQVNGNSSLYKIIHKHNMETIKETADALAHQKDAVMKNHFKLLAIISSGIFIIFFLFFWAMYAVTVPSESKLESLKQEKAQLIADINQIRINRSEWIRDAQKNGYLNR